MFKLNLKEKDEYNNEVVKIARPVPVDYFIVDLTAAFAATSVYTFYESKENSFPIENREQINEIQVNNNFFF